VRKICRLREPKVTGSNPLGRVPHRAASRCRFPRFHASPSDSRSLCRSRRTSRRRSRRSTSRRRPSSRDQSRQLEAAARARARGATSARETLRGAGEKLTDERLQTIADLRTRLDDATEAEQRLATEAFPGQRLPNTGQGAWREMWEAARRDHAHDRGGVQGRRAVPGSPAPTLLLLLLLLLLLRLCCGLTRRTAAAPGRAARDRGDCHDG